MKKYWEFFLLIKGNGFIVWHWRQGSQYNFIEWQGARFTPQLIFQILLFSTQKNHAEWETTMERQPFCSGGELLPTNLFLKLFLQHGLRFSVFKAAQVRYWKAPMKVGIRQPHNTNVTQRGKYWWLMNMWVPLEGTWPLRWMKVHMLISLSFTFNFKERKGAIRGDEKRNTQ